MRPIPNFPSYYVTHLGDIISTKYKNGKLLRPGKLRTGYNIVTLRNEGKNYTKLVHRLVAECYLPNPNNLEQVDHINHDLDDNSVFNLQWITPLENKRKTAYIHRYVIHDLITDTYIETDDITNWCKTNGASVPSLYRGGITKGRYTLIERSKHKKRGVK